MKRFFCPIKMICAAFIVCITFSVQALDILFVVYDTADLNAILRIIQSLPRTYSYKLVAFGKAADLCTYSGCVKIKGDFSSRESLLSGSDLKEIFQDQPKVIMVGMASAAQAQVLNMSGLDPKHQLAFYDNFDPPRGKDYIQPFLKTIRPRSVTYLVSAGFLKPDFVALKNPVTDQSIVDAHHVKIVGQPVLGDWKMFFDKTNVQDKNELRAKLNVSPHQKIIVWATDTVDGHEKYLTVFAKALKQNPSWVGLVTLHPKLDASTIQSILTPIGASNVTIVPKTGPTTNQIATVASVLAVHQSSVGPQAFYAGDTVIYVAPPSYKNFMMEKGLAPRFDSVTELSAYLKSFEPGASTQNIKRMEEAGIPVAGPGDIDKALEEALGDK